MKPQDTVIDDIIADSQEAAQHRDTLDRRQFLTRLATGVGGIGGRTECTSGVRTAE